jgi:hypothetical protein
MQPILLEVTGDPGDDLKIHSAWITCNARQPIVIFATATKSLLAEPESPHPSPDKGLIVLSDFLGREGFATLSNDLCAASI